MWNGFDDFINKIIDIEKQLDGLLYKNSEDLVDDLINETKNIDFADKNILINKYANLMHIITHEIGSTIGFYVGDICELKKYMDYRIKYKNYTDEILEKIIDTELTLTEKKEIFKENNNKEIINMIKEIKQNWNKTFDNISNKKLKEVLKLNEY
jgi:hypothetical protein